MQIFLYLTKFRGYSSRKLVNHQRIQTFQRRGRERGGSHSDPEIRLGGWGGARSPKPFFPALRASFWSKNKGGDRTLVPLPWIRHRNRCYNWSLKGAMSRRYRCFRVNSVLKSLILQRFYPHKKVSLIVTKKISNRFHREALTIIHFF